jgi:opacity protein-like surface antigen
MKKLWLLLFVLIASSSLAQAQLKPVKGDLGLGFRFSGLADLSLDEFSTDAFGAPQVLVRYYLSNKFALRASIGVDLNSGQTALRSSVLDSVNFDTIRRIDSTVKTSVDRLGFSITPGIEYHLKSQAAKLDPYVGVTIPISYLGGVTTESDEEISIYDFGSEQDVFISELTTTLEEPGALSFGVNLLGGFNYFFSDNFAIGAEYSLGFIYTSIGGDNIQTTKGTIQPTSDPTNVLVVDSRSELDLTGTNLSLGVATAGGVNISIFW